MNFAKALGSTGKKFFSTKMVLKLIACSKCFEGEQRVYMHHSKTLKCEMKLGVYMPPSAINGNAECPVLYYLSGLNNTHESFIQRSGMQRYASKHELIIVNTDTSPRNVIPEENDSAEFGAGSSFYIDATVEPWSKHYKMYSYVTQELPKLINSNLAVSPTKISITGHSMGGHGALICALKNPGLYQSVSAMAPVANTTKSILARKNFTGYLGTDEYEWQQWDATCLAEKYVGKNLEFFIDQGGADEFLIKKELLPYNFINAVAKNDRLNVIFKLRDGYDHGYHYVSTFIGEHIAYHAKMLKE